MLRSRTTLPTLALLTLAGCGGSDAGGDTTGPAAERFSATLAGSSVVPATTSTNSGTISLESVPGDSIVKFSLSVSNMAGITQAHLHSGAAGANGAILAWLLPVNGTAAQAPSVALDGVISLGDIAPSWIRGTPRLTMDSVKALMVAGRVYVDLHSSTNTAGELRGQVARLP
ncbi:MAG: CHRD domain-containing protein [Gemmatimonadaceae bacterium]|nr:CHRD domain-containing protein [Gemmatimonadaceae bacterium]